MMPIIESQAQRDALIADCKADIERTEDVINACHETGILNELRWYESQLLRQHIALAALEAEPVYWEIAGQLFSTKEEALKPGYRGTPEPLFEEAPVPALKPVVLPAAVDSSNVPFAAHSWNTYRNEAIKAIREAGYPVEGE